MRYKTPRGLANHIQVKHPTYPGANDNAIDLQQPPAASAAPASMASLAAAPAAAAAQRKCAICHQLGHRADNRKFHPILPSA
jgi:zona occludens toxin (predicted ATPase)